MSGKALTKNSIKIYKPNAKSEPAITSIDISLALFCYSQFCGSDKFETPLLKSTCDCRYNDIF